MIVPFSVRTFVWLYFVDGFKLSTIQLNVFPIVHLGKRAFSLKDSDSLMTASCLDLRAEPSVGALMAPFSRPHTGSVFGTLGLAGLGNSALGQTSSRAPAPSNLSASGPGPYFTGLSLPPMALSIPGIVAESGTQDCSLSLSLLLDRLDRRLAPPSSLLTAPASKDAAAGDRKLGADRSSSSPPAANLKKPPIIDFSPDSDDACPELDANRQPLSSALLFPEFPHFRCHIADDSTSHARI